MNKSADVLEDNPVNVKRSKILMVTKDTEYSRVWNKTLVPEIKESLLFKAQLRKKQESIFFSLNLNLKWSKILKNLNI